MAGLSSGFLEALHGSLLESGKGFSLQMAYCLLYLHSPFLNEFWSYCS